MNFLIFLGLCFVVYLLISNKKERSSKKRTIQSGYDRRQVQTRSNATRYGYSDSNTQDDLATFTISYGYEEEKSKNKTKGRWMKNGEKVSIHGYSISGGNFYFGGQLKAYSFKSKNNQYSETEASLIDDFLKVTKESKTFEDNSLTYWPKYVSLSPKARGAYLDWLASDRNDPNTPIGYVFIYFYGLERRVVVDGSLQKLSETDFLDIYVELMRLKEIFDFNHSFKSYSNRLIDYIFLVRPDVVSKSNYVFSQGHESLSFKLNLAKTVNEGKPIPSDLALSWVKFDYEYTLRTPARRCEDEFSQLFNKEYEEKFAEGLIVKPNKTKLKLDYYPASNTISDVTIRHEDLPDPSILSGPKKKFISIAEDCTSLLDPYSRYLGRKDTSKEDIAALLLLPEGISSSNSSGIQHKLKSWIEARLVENNGLVAVADFWKFTNTPLPQKINKREAELIQKLAEKVGYGIAPDLRYHLAKPNPEGVIVLLNQIHGDSFDPSNSFAEIGMALRLGAMVAQIDSEVHLSEVQVLKNLIVNNPHLSDLEKSSLNAYLTWRLNTPANMNGLKARIGSLDNEQKSLISHILIGVALADGRIDLSEIKQLEKLYVALGLEKERVSSDIHNISSAKVANQDVAQKTEEKPSFTLNEDVLALHESETSDVKEMLGAIFAEDIVENEEELKVTSQIGGDGLDPKTSQFFQALIKKEQWTREEITSLCQELELMVDGALEAINDWSYDQVDSPVLEDNGDIYVDQEIVVELRG